MTIMTIWRQSLNSPKNPEVCPSLPKVSIMLAICFLLYYEEQVAGSNYGALGGGYLLYGAVLRSENFVLHLHGLDYEEDIAGLYGLSLGDLDVEDVSGER